MTRTPPTPLPESEYAIVDLRNLDHSADLSGAWANITYQHGQTGLHDSNEFHYDRNQDEFEQAMGYFWVDRAQEYLQSLGFGSGLPGDPEAAVRRADRPVRRRQLLHVGQAGPDPARQGRGRRRRGRRGDRPRVRPRRAPRPGPRIRQSIDAGAIGESFGDYLAVSVGLDAASDHSWPVDAEEACPMDWDATSYDPTLPTASVASTPSPSRPPREQGIHTSARSGARRCGRSGSATSRGADHRGLGHHPDQLAVRLRARHHVPGGGPGDVRRGAGPRRRHGGGLVREKFAERGITF